MGTSSIETRAPANGLTGPICVGSGLSGNRLLVLLKPEPQPMVLLEQDLYLGHGLSGHRTMTAATATTKSIILSTGPSGFTGSRTVVSGSTGQDPQQHKNGWVFRIHRLVAMNTWDAPIRLSDVQSDIHLKRYKEKC